MPKKKENLLYKRLQREKDWKKREHLTCVGISFPSPQKEFEQREKRGETKEENKSDCFHRKKKLNCHGKAVERKRAVFHWTDRSFLKKSRREGGGGLKPLMDGFIP